MRVARSTSPKWVLALLAAALPVACGEDETGDGGGANTPQSCQVDAECASSDPCSIRSCGEDQKCHAEQAPDGESEQQVPGDCKKVMCQGGLASEERDQGDVDDDHEPCTLDRCGDAGPEHVPQIDDLPCVVGLGGGFCLDGQCKVPCVMLEGSNQCDDLRPCTEDSCGPDAFCAHEDLSGMLPPEMPQPAGDCHELVCEDGEVVDEVDDTDAPDDGDLCTEDLCKSGEPLHQDVPPGAKSTEDPTPGDCAAYFCDSEGEPSYEPDDGDVPVDADPCTDDVCTEGSPENPPAAQGTPCASGKVCDGYGACCTPTTCAAEGAACGKVPDGCNGTLSCGGCNQPDWCGGGGVDNQCGCSLSAQQGPKHATLAVNVTSVGNVPWEYLENIGASDNTTVRIGGMSGDDVSHYLKVTGYDFDVPSFATVKGIQVEWRRGELYLPGYISDNAVRIVKSGAIGSADKSKTTGWSGLSNVLYGGSTDLWGESWTPADINAASFGAALSAKYDGAGNDTAEVDSARITVHFTVASCQ